MKIIILIFLTILIYCDSYGQEKSRRKHLYYYEQKKSLFELLPNDENEIIFAGNSITDGCEWSELFRDNRIKNRGISSDVAEGLLLRLDEITESKPQKIFIMIGINDLAFGYSISEIIQYLQTIVKKIDADSPKTKIYIQSILPINKSFKQFKGYKHLTDQIISLNDRLLKFALNSDVTFIDLYVSFQINKQLNPDFTNDGLHLTGKGYLLWKSLIEQYIKE